MRNAMSSMRRPLLAASTGLLCLLGLLCPTGPGLAAPPPSFFAPAAPASAPAPGASVAAVPSHIEAISAAEITARADSDEQFIRAVADRAAAADELKDFDEALARQSAAVENLSRQAGGGDLEALSLRRLESLQRHWQLYEQQIADLRASLSRATRLRSEDAAELADRRAAWQATRAASPDLAPALLQRIDELVGQTERAEQAVSPPLSRLFELGRRAGALSARAQLKEAEVGAQIDDQDRRLLWLDSPPLWQGAAADVKEVPMKRGLQKSVAIETDFARDYNEANARLMRVLTAIGLLLLPLLLWIRHRAERLIAEGGAAEESLRPLTRPWSAWLVLLALGSIWFDLQGPTVRQQLVMLLAWLPVIRLLPRQMSEGVGPWAYLSAAFYLLNLLASLLVGSEFVYRILMVAMDLLMLAALVWLMRRALRNAPAGLSVLRRRFRVFMFGLGAATMTAAVIANVLGNASLATMLTGAVLDSTYLALSMYAAATVLVALFRVMRGQPNAASRDSAAGSLLGATAKVARTLLALACFLIVLQAFRLYRPLADFVGMALRRSVNFGDLSLSVGNVVAFVVAVWVAFWLSRMIRLLLAEEILPSMALPSGVANSISTLSYYTILSLGLLAALAVLGFPLGQLALIFGALGVGIGFGLQDVVKNFVAGLILMFERPIRPGDVVDVAGMSGTVREIGMRVTIVTTFDGADVVVPNGMLLADKLVNWTLSGSVRRVELTVNTYPGDSPRRTIALLAAIAGRVAGVASNPAPLAVMNGSADGVLQFSLRVWTVDGSDWVAVRSELALSVREGLAEAGIDVPRPQSELHLPAGPVRELAAGGGERRLASRTARPDAEPGGAERLRPVASD